MEEENKEMEKKRERDKQKEGSQARLFWWKDNFLHEVKRKKKIFTVERKKVKKQNNRK